MATPDSDPNPQPPPLDFVGDVALTLLRDGYAACTIRIRTGIAADTLYALAAAHGITAPCGTVEGHGCHLARGEEPCWECTTAEGRAQARLAATRRRTARVRPIRKPRARHNAGPGR